MGIEPYRNDAHRKPNVMGMAVVLAAALVSPAWANINLEFRPASQTVAVSDTVGIGMYAVSDSPASQSFSAIDLILGWDPVFLQLLGVDLTGAVPLLFSGFPSTDPYGLNEAVPPADGDGFYMAWAPFTGPVYATPAGVLVTTFQFAALGETPGTLADMLESAGSPLGYTTVWDGEIENHPVTGTLDSALVVIIPEPTSLALLAAASLVLLRGRRRSDA
ncbi:MAG: PEP-CTERM sorting domain-containing protein [Planctomycetota bacterium]